MVGLLVIGLLVLLAALVFISCDGGGPEDVAIHASSFDHSGFDAFVESLKSSGEAATKFADSLGGIRDLRTGGRIAGSVLLERG
jgi:hypothetical protein